jgi:hypothetical protein
MNPTVAKTIELTDEVQLAIEAGDWQRAHELEIERRALLEQLAATPLGAAGMEPELAALEERTARLIGLVQHHRRRVLREAAVARSAQDGVAAYAGASADKIRA